ncbi:hypothetical protein [Sulfurimonas sp.]
MSAFNKVLEAIQGKPQNGHALANLQNKASLAKAKKEIEEMLR